MKKIILASSLFVISIISFGQKKLTQETIDEFGTKTFTASKKDIFETIIKVFESKDYLIDYESFEKGKIITKKKVLGETGMSTGPGSAQFTRNYRQYSVSIDSVSPQRTKVIMTPKVFIGEGDVSDKKVWVLKGPAGEIKLWENFFTSIQERL